MSTEKITISIPSDLVSMIDDIRSERGASRSKFITLLLREKIMDEQARQIRKAYDHVFPNESIVQEQLDTAAFVPKAFAEIDNGFKLVLNQL